MNPITSFTGEYHFLSNFFPRPFLYLDIEFPTAEHAFQAAKVVAIIPPNIETANLYLEKIRTASIPARAKYYGRSIHIDVDFWNENKVIFMRRILRAKFDQNEDLRKMLINTSPVLLIEGNNWGDVYWGRCNGRGSNILGVLLMELRGYYVSQS